MASTGSRVQDDVRHLGTIVGDPRQGLIVALSTSSVFDDTSLVRSYWERDSADIDSGFQGHLYTGPDDIFAVNMSRNDDGAIDMVETALDANAEIWAATTGIRLCTSGSRLILACARERSGCAPHPRLSWHVAPLTETAAAEYRLGTGAFLAFVLDLTTLSLLTRDDRQAQTFSDQARLTSLLMDKTRAMALLQNHDVPRAQSWGFTSESWRSSGQMIPSAGRYVFKPAGGAAGIGVHYEHGDGSTEFVKANEASGSLGG
ncbi:hypothetical protein [Cryobacterium sp. CG_9.6]|uniref:hypothetical protein n=1 Tax=Cryobacterium sp. CG_9.6 TaxID=2760710 RepID=UPI002473DBB4|nr:hypothetical protein [Cryobacterium sp. CG_9.6]MDH6236825.1 hypothetical protein [Cryobacterium sp. CG_9.6]